MSKPLNIMMRMITSSGEQIPFPAFFTAGVCRVWVSNLVLPGNGNAARGHFTVERLVLGLQLHPFNCGELLDVQHVLTVDGLRLKHTNTQPIRLSVSAETSPNISSYLTPRWLPAFAIVSTCITPSLRPPLVSLPPAQVCVYLFSLLWLLLGSSCFTLTAPSVFWVPFYVLQPASLPRRWPLLEAHLKGKNTLKPNSASLWLDASSLCTRPTRNLLYGSFLLQTPCSSFTEITPGPRRRTHSRCCGVLSLYSLSLRVIIRYLALALSANAQNQRGRPTWPPQNQLH